MKILHIIRDLNDERALQTARSHADKHQVTLLLLQDAVLSQLEWPNEVFACRDDVEARGGRPGFKEVGYREIVRMTFDHDRVVMW